MTSRRIPFVVALIPFLSLIALQGLIIFHYGADSLNGASQVGLLLTSAITVLISVVFYKFDYSAFEKSIAKSIAGVSTALVMLMLIGALSGIWMVSGVVPYLINLGLNIISPTIFIPTACLICAAISIVTGSSWTTIATIGVALIGIGRANGFSDGWVAGAIISGAYFGDKMSPLSDTTVLASQTVGTPLFEHIKFMTRTTIPTLTISLVIFSIANFVFSPADNGDVSLYCSTLQSTFTLSHWLLLVPAITAFLIYKRTPAIPVLFFATLAATVAALVFQPHILATIGNGNCFPGAMQSIFGATNIETGNAELDSLIATGGIAGVMNTIWLIICAMVFGGTMEASGVLHTIMQRIVAMAKRTTAIVAATSASGVILNAVTCDQYLSVILLGSLFKDKYKQNNLPNKLLSRTIEDGTTVTSVLVPWSTCGMTQATVLGVASTTFIPYCVFNYLSPIITIIMSYRYNGTPTQPSTSVND